MVGLAAGGITDVTARLYAEAVSKSIGQRVTVENKTGAGGGVAAAAVQNAAPDGYTLLVFSGSQHATVPAVSNANYDPVKGFSPITYLFNSVVVLTVPADSPVKTMDELHDWGRKKPGGLDRRHAGARLAVASARRQDPARGQGAVGDGALSRRRADDGRPDHRPRRLGLADAVDVALLSRRRQAARAGARRRHALGRRCRTCRRWSSSASPTSASRAGSRSAGPPACRRRWSPRSATSSSRRRRTPSCKGG